MSLSDVCSDFVATMREAESDAARRDAVIELQQAVEHYRDYPISYGSELQTVADACAEFLGGPPTLNADAVERIIFVADTVRAFLDMLPGAEAPSS